MRVLFCSDPLNRRSPDPAFGLEVRAAESATLDYSLMSYEALVDEENPAGHE